MLASDGSAELLPRSSTKLEADLLRIESFDELGGSIDRISTAKYPDRPNDWLIWLLVEMNLVQFMEFVPDMRTLLLEGDKMNQWIGTEAAVKQAAGWLDYSLDVEQYKKPTLHFPEWSVKLKGATPLFRQMDDLCRMARLMKLVQPARSRFKRVYNSDYDRRKMIWSNTRWGKLYSGVSGVHTTEINTCSESHGMQVSLGRVHFIDPESLFGQDNDIDYDVKHYHPHTESWRPKAWPNLDNDYYRSFYPNYMDSDYSRSPINV
jgi:hypothetical protein